MTAAIISAAAAIFVAALTVFLSKMKEREAEWRSKKLAYYEEFFSSVSGIVGDAQLAEKNKFARAVNNLHLVASQNALDALNEFCDEIADSKPDLSKERHDMIWSRLVWHIRADLGDAPSKPLLEFKARLWTSGTGTEVV